MPAGDAESTYAAIARNLRSALSVYSLSTVRGSVVELEGVSLVNSGVDYAVFNAAVFYEKVNGHTPVGELIDQAAAHYDTHDLGWSCWVCEELLGDRLDELTSHLKRHGLRASARHQGMVADRLVPPARPLPAVEMRRVGDKPSRLDFVQISSQVFALPLPVAHRIYDSERFWAGGFMAWIGYVEDRPVCTAAVDSSCGVVGLYSVGTLHRYQRRGYGEKVTRHVLEESCRASNLSRSILQSTREGLPLYRKMGFRPMGRFSVYVSR